GEGIHSPEERCRSGRVPRHELLLAALCREHGPDVTGALAARRPWPSVARAIAIAVAVVAMPADAARGRRLDRRVHDGERLEDVRVVGGQLAEPHELQ